jgi:hypothetical protein
MAFGLVGILGTLIAIVFALSYLLPRSQPAINAAVNAQQQARQIAGRDVNNAPATDSITLASEDANGRMTGVLVTSVTPGGAMDKHFGLKRNDTIVEIGMGHGLLQPVNQMSTAGEARDALLTAYEQSQSIVVIRDEKRITLPQAQPAASPTVSANGNSSESAQAPQSDKSAFQRQLDSIQKIPMH